jgi:hypothetical protein
MVQVPADGNPLNTTLPVARVQVGWVTVPATGAVGIPATGLITTLADAPEVHPAVLVTVNVYVPGARPLIVVLIPVPVVATAPGDRVMVHVPVAGSPFNTMLPVATTQVGCVMVPVTGAIGIPPAGRITTLADVTEIHPPALVTVKV